MKKRLVLIGIILLSFLPYLSAETVSMKEARRIARLFFNDAYGEICPEPNYVFNGKRFTTDRLFTPFYVFDSPEGGFVIISAENKAFPILGYSLMPKGHGFDKDNLTQEDRDLLTGFSRDIELIRFDSRYPSEAASAWEDLPSTIHEILYANSLPADGYYRYRPNDSKMWIVREKAVEFPYEWPKTDEELERERAALEEPEEEPFSFYDDFIREITRSNEEKAMALEERLKPSKPVVRSLGGAHFVADIPENALCVDIYGADGHLAKRRYFRGANSLPLDLSELPNGFYFALIHLESGKTSGIKLYR